MRKILSILLLIAGLAIFFAPTVLTLEQGAESEKAITAFTEAAEEGSSTSSDGSTEEDTSGYSIITGTDTLFKQVQEYNAYLAENGQDGVMDAWSVTQTPSGIDVLDGGMFGYITIPAMDVELPLYVGASTANMAKGAAILGATSLPVGGESTNCVIAGHRGYRGVPYFREIEKLSVGDVVYVTNPWETLTYRVESIDIIDPYDVDAIKIKEGKDMVTLLTCHPYRSHGKYRYVVYCVRDESGAEVDNNAGTDDTGTITASDGTVYDSSQKDITFEKLFRLLCGAVIAIIFLTVIFGGRGKEGGKSAGRKKQERGQNRPA